MVLRQSYFTETRVQEEEGMGEGWKKEGGQEDGRRKESEGGMKGGRQKNEGREGKDCRKER